MHVFIKQPFEVKKRVWRLLLRIYLIWNVGVIKS